jgi:hypothetical protein
VALAEAGDADALDLVEGQIGHIDVEEGRLAHRVALVSAPPVRGPPAPRREIEAPLATSEMAMAGTPSRKPSVAAATVPE